MNYIYGVYNSCLDGNENQLIESSISNVSFSQKKHLKTEEIITGNLSNRTPQLIEYKNWIINCYARLDYTDEIIALLDFKNYNTKDISNELIIAKAYEKWGKDCVDFLIGEFVFAIWDKQEKEWFIAKDHLGSTGVYYTYQNNQFVFASSLQPFVKLKLANNVNEIYFVGILATWRPKDGESIYKKIFHLPPGHFITFKNNRLQKNRYWFPENTSTLNLKNSNDYVEGLLDYYQKAIDTKLKPEDRYGIMLSGGLDSSSALALMAKSNNYNSFPIQAFTYQMPIQNKEHLVGKHNFINELYFAQQTTQYLGNIEHHVVNGEKYSVLEGIEKMLEINQMPFHGVMNAFWILEINNYIQQHGIRAVISAQGGNATVSWAGLKNPENIQNWIKGKTSFSRLIKQNGRNFLNWLQSYQSQFNPVIAKNIIQRNETEIYEILNSDDFKHIKNQSIKSRLNILKPHYTTHGQIKQDMGMYFNFDILDPTRDKKLIEFCLSVPNEQFRNKNQDRVLIRTACKNLLPETVRLNPKRGVQYYDVIRKTQQILPELESLLNELKTHKEINEYLNLNSCSNIIKELKNNPNYKETNRCGKILLAGIAFGLFLKKHLHHN